MKKSIALATLAVLLCCIRPVFDFDVWFDMRMGDYIWSNQTIPHFMNFLWEHAQLKPVYWPADEWGFDVLSRCLWGMGGVTALELYVAVAAAGAYLLNAWAARRRGVGLGSIVAVALPFVMIESTRLMPRPQLVTDLFLATFAVVATTRRSWLFPLLLVAWSNMHGGAFAGLVFCGALWVGDVIEKRPTAKAMGGYTALCVGALMANPGGWHQLQYIVENFATRPLPVAWVEEWRPTGWNPWFWGTVALLVVGLGAGWRKGRVRLGDVLVALGFTFLGFRYGRALSDYLAATLSLQMLALDCLVPISDRWAPWAALTGLAYRVGVMMVAAGIFQPLVPTLPVFRQESQNVEGAVAFMRRSHVSPALFNTYHLGGQLAWYGSPDYLPFIHGLTSMFGDDLLKRYGDVVNGGQSVLDHFGVQTLVLGYPLLPGDATGQCLAWVEASPLWKLVYFDDDALVYVRAGTTLPTYQHVVPGKPDAWHLSDAGVAEELARSVADAPTACVTNCWLGQTVQASDPARAVELYRTAELAHPANPLPHFCLGQAYGGLGRLGVARAEYERGWSLGQGTAIDAINLAKICDKQGDAGAAHHWIDKALLLSPGDPRATAIQQSLH